MHRRNLNTMKNSRLNAESNKPIVISQPIGIKEGHEASSAEEVIHPISNVHARDRRISLPLSSFTLNTLTSNEHPCKAIGIPKIIEVKGYSETGANQDNHNEVYHEIMLDDGTSNHSHIDDTNSISNDYDTSVVLDRNVVENGQNHYMTPIFNITMNHSNLGLVGALSLSILSLLSIALIPYHNVILHHYYWYESIFPFITGCVPWLVAVVTVQITIVPQFEKIRRPSVIFKLCITMATSFAISHCFIHLLWSYHLGYNSLIPFSLCFDCIVSAIAFWIVLWHEFPKDVRSNSTYRNRLIAYFLKFS